MIILPAVDILDGNCVRLKKGEFNTAENMASDPLSAAMAFKANGAEYLHVVDLNGAREGKMVNNEIICSLKAECGIPVEVGGGIRDIKTIEYYLSRGISRVILGSAALTDPKLVQEAVNEYGSGIAVGIDAKGGKVSIAGWSAVSEIDYIEFAQMMEAIGVTTVIFTDIDRDGMLSGIDYAKYESLAGMVDMNIIASGGIKDINDIRTLAEMKMFGAICGKSLYSRSLDLREAIAAGKGQN